MAGGGVDLNGVADSWSDGASTLNLIVPVTAASGVYNVTSVDVTDGAGNVATYSPTQLTALGIATSLSIVGGQHGAPAVTMGANVTYGGGGSSPTFSGAVTDTVALTTVNVYSGATFIGTAAINTVTHTWSLTAALSAGLYSAWNVIATDVTAATATAQASFTLQTGILGQAYVTIEADYSGALLIDKRFLRSDGSIYLNEIFVGGVKTSDTYYVTGLAYSSYEYDYNLSGHYTDIKYFGYTNSLYATSEVDYSWSSVTKKYTRLDQKLFRANNSLYEETLFNPDGTQTSTYYGVTGHTYTSYEIDYAVGGHYTAYKYFGYVNSYYVSSEIDYTWSSITSTYTRTEQKYFHADQSLYEAIIYNTNGTQNSTYYGVTGHAYTSYENDFDISSHYTAIKYFGFSGLPYVSLEYDYSWSSVTKLYTPTQTKYFRTDQSLYENIIYNSDHTQAYTYYSVTGKAYTSYEIDYDASVHYTALKYFGYTGQSYVTAETDYAWSWITKFYTRTQQKYFRADESLYESVVYNTNGIQIWTYYGVINQAYTSYETDFDSSGHYTAKKYFGYTGNNYTITESDYTWLSSTSSYTLFEQKYMHSDLSLYETVLYNSNQTQALTYYGITIQIYTSHEIDLDSNSHYYAKIYFGYTGQPYAKLEEFYSWSATGGYYLLEDKYFRADASVYEDKTYSTSGTVDRFYEITGYSYTSDEFDYDATGTLLREVYYSANGLPNQMITHNADTSLTYDYYQVTGTTYSSYEIVREANGTERSQTFNYNDGAHQIDGEENNTTLLSTPGDDTIYGNGQTSTAFGWGILFQFDPGFGHDLVADFYSRTTASDLAHPADTIQLPKTEFTDFNAFCLATTPGPSGTVTTAANGDTLTLYGMTLASLQAAQGDFKFV